jgi:hypothetical protein
VSIRCPRCEAQLERIDVPPAAASLFSSSTAGGCPVCLTVVDAGVGDDSAASSVLGSVDPAAAAAVWSVIRDLPQLAMSHDRLDRALALAEEQGVDVFLHLERLAADPAVDAHFDIDRRRRQLAAFVD